MVEHNLTNQNKTKPKTKIYLFKEICAYISLGDSQFFTVRLATNQLQMSHINVTWLKYSFIPEILLEILRETLLFSSPEKWMTAGVFCSKSFISLSSVVLGGWFISFLFVVSLNRFCCRVQMLHAGQFIPFTLPTILTSNNHYYLFPVMVIPMKQTALDYKRAVMVI